MIITKEEIEAVLAGCDGVTPGPYESDGIKNDGFESYEVTDPNGRSIADTLNAGSIEIYEEDGHSWDEQGRKNMAHIARLPPEFVRDLATLALEALSSREAGWQGKIKPLEWDDTTFGAISSAESYFVERSGAAIWVRRGHFGTIQMPDGRARIFKTAAEAKAAAQADYEARIRSALLPNPPDQGSKSP